MKFFLLKTAAFLDVAPDVKDWTTKIDKRAIKKGLANKLPKRELLLIRDNPDTLFPDVLTYPFFLVTGMVHDVIKMYEPHTAFKEIILLDQANFLSEIYYLPILNHCACLSAASELTRDRSVIKKAVIHFAQTENRSIFYVGDVGNQYVMARLDFVESILRRGARGLGLEPVEIDKLPFAP